MITSLSAPIRFLLTMCVLFVASLTACSDGETTNTDDNLGVVDAHLNRVVGPHKNEMNIAAQIFHVQIHRKAKALEKIILDSGVDSLAEFDLNKFKPVFSREAKNLKGLDPELLHKHVVVDFHDVGDEEDAALSVLLKGSNDKRRLVILTGALNREVAPGVGTSSIELATALEVLRVFISQRVHPKPAKVLPFDLQYIHLKKSDPNLVQVDKIVPKDVTLIGAVAIGELAPENLANSNLVVQVIPKQESTIRSAMSGCLQSHDGGSLWQTASLSANLPDPAQSTIKRNQSLLPYLVLCAASSKKDRGLKAPWIHEPWPNSPKQIDSIHPAAGTKDDRLKSVAAPEMEPAVAVARALGIAITRCQAAFPQTTP